MRSSRLCCSVSPKIQCVLKSSPCSSPCIVCSSVKYTGRPNVTWDSTVHEYWCIAVEVAQLKLDWRTLDIINGITRTVRLSLVFRVLTAQTINEFVRMQKDINTVIRTSAAKYTGSRNMADLLLFRWKTTENVLKSEAEIWPFCACLV